VRLGRLAEAVTFHRREPVLVPDGSSRISDEGLRNRLMAQFATETPQVIAEMRAALLAQDWTRLRGRAHYLKNSADVLGAAALQRACQRLAAIPESPSVEDARLLMEEVEAAIPAQFSGLAGLAPTDKY
jgi:HPt (histidine-containing phosphotransfer) domain-containing protein